MEKELELEGSEETVIAKKNLIHSFKEFGLEPSTQGNIKELKK